MHSSERGMGRSAARIVLYVELGMTILILLGIGYSAWHLLDVGYLPSPFFFDLGDSLMDGYSTAYYAHNPGAYEKWGTVYPPLTFVFMRFTSMSKCYFANDYEFARTCDWLLRDSIFGFFFLNVPLVWKCYAKQDISTAVPRTIALTVGFPMLFALDRLNIIIVTFSCFVLAYGGVVRSAWARAIAAGAAFNFKPYLVLSIAPALIRRQWTRLEYVGLATLMIYILTFAILGEGSPTQIFNNIVYFGNYFASNTGTFITTAAFSSSYDPIYHVLRGDSIGVLMFINSRSVNFWKSTIWIAIRAAQIGTILCYTAGFLSPSRVSFRRYSAMIVAALLTNSDAAGAYSIIFLLFLVFMEKPRGIVTYIMLLSAYVLCIPADYTILPIINRYGYSFWGNREVFSNPGLTVGTLLRPGLVLIIQYGYFVLALRAIFASPKGKDRGVPGAGRSSPLAETPF